jgi:hypothetical protein
LGGWRLATAPTGTAGATAAWATRTTGSAWPGPGGNRGHARPGGRRACDAGSDWSDGTTGDAAPARSARTLRSRRLARLRGAATAMPWRSAHRHQLDLPLCTPTGPAPTGPDSAACAEPTCNRRR